MSAASLPIVAVGVSFSRSNAVFLYLLDASSHHSLLLLPLLFSSLAAMVSLANNSKRSRKVSRANIVVAAQAVALAAMTTAGKR